MIHTCKLAARVFEVRVSVLGSMKTGSPHFAGLVGGGRTWSALVGLPGFLAVGGVGGILFLLGLQDVVEEETS